MSTMPVERSTVASKSVKHPFLPYILTLTPASYGTTRHIDSAGRVVRKSRELCLAPGHSYYHTQFLWTGTIVGVKQQLITFEIPRTEALTSNLVVCVRYPVFKCCSRRRAHCLLQIVEITQIWFSQQDVNYFPKSEAFSNCLLSV